jgi:lysophospholipid acyltransferase (LPLAT)-like uncharacterized protein
MRPSTFNLPGTDAVRIRSRFLIRTATWCLRILFKALFATCRKELLTAHPDASAYIDTRGNYFLFCFWHDEILGPIFADDTKNCAALVSRHSDASIVADIVESFGMKPIRGSSKRGGATALRQMIHEAETCHICIATDGPQGPRRVVKDGIVFLASQSGKPIAPVAFTASRMWRPRAGWTDLAIPWPFSRITVCVSWPIPVPADLDRDGIERYRLLVQAEMDRLSIAAQARQRGEAVALWPESSPYGEQTAARAA